MTKSRVLLEQGAKGTHSPEHWHIFLYSLTFGCLVEEATLDLTEHNDRICSVGEPGILWTEQRGKNQKYFNSVFSVDITRTIHESLLGLILNE